MLFTPVLDRIKTGLVFTLDASLFLDLGELWTNSIKPDKILKEILQTSRGTDEECTRAIEAVLSPTIGNWTRPGWTLQSKC